MTETAKEIASAPAGRAPQIAEVLREFVDGFNTNSLDDVVTSSPILTFNWKAPSSEEWVVPFGGGGGKIFKLGKLPLNGSVQGFYNVRPSDSTTIGRWQARVQLVFLFPRAKPKAAAQQAPEQAAQSAAPRARSAALVAPSQH